MFSNRFCLRVSMKGKVLLAGSQSTLLCASVYKQEGWSETLLKVSFWFLNSALHCFIQI